MCDTVYDYKSASKRELIKLIDSVESEKFGEMLKKLIKEADFITSNQYDLIQKVA